METAKERFERMQAERAAAHAARTPEERKAAAKAAIDAEKARVSAELPDFLRRMGIVDSDAKAVL